MNGWPLKLTKQVKWFFMNKWPLAFHVFDDEIKFVGSI
jgi:hypothetical protein